jgi:hypothetical protein
VIVNFFIDHNDITAIRSEPIHHGSGYYSPRFPIPCLGKRLEVHALNAIGQRLYALHFGRPKIASRDVIQSLLTEAARDVDGQKFSRHFFLTEWEEVVDAWQMGTWEAYRDVRRLGRKTRLPEPQCAHSGRCLRGLHSQLESQGLNDSRALS